MTPELETEQALDRLAAEYDLDIDGEELLEMAFRNLERRGIVERKGGDD